MAAGNIFGNNIPYLPNETNYSLCSDHSELVTITTMEGVVSIYEYNFVVTISWKNRNSGSKCMMGKAVWLSGEFVTKGM